MRRSTYTELEENSDEDSSLEDCLWLEYDEVCHRMKEKKKSHSAKQHEDVRYVEGKCIIHRSLVCGEMRDM